MPFVMSLMGWGTGLLALLFVNIMAHITSGMLVRVCLAEACRSYDRAIERLLGTKALHAYQVMVFLSTSGSLISIFIMCGDFICSLARTTQYRQLSIVLLAVVVIFPLLMLRTMKSLWFVSLLSSVLVFVLSGVLLVKSASSDGPHAHFQAFGSSYADFFRALPIMVRGKHTLEYHEYKYFSILKQF